MANQDFRVKNGLQVGLGASVVGIVTAESFTGSAVGLTSVPSASLTGTISSERLSGTYDIDILGTVSGATISATTATVTEQLNVGAGNTGVFATATDGTLSVTGITTFKDTTDNTLGDATTGAVQIRGGLGISSNVTVGGGLSVTGDSYFVGMVTFASGTDGNISIGDSSGDNVVINAQIDSDLIPDDDDTYDLGSSTKEWQDLYIDGTANIDSLVADTAAIGDLTDNQVVVAGTSGELEGDANLTYDGTELIVGTATTGSVVRTDGTLNVSGISTFQDRVIFDSTNSIQVPVGTDAEKDSVGTAVTGQIRYNTTNSQFEGFGPGNDWGSLGGVKDVDGDTYVKPESSPGSDEDALTFFTGGTERAVIDSDGNVGISTTNPTATLDVDGTLDVSGISTFQNNVEIHSTGYLQIPVGLSTDRPTGTGVTLGQIRYNSELSQFEGYGAGDAWGSLGGIKDVDQDTYITAESSAGADDDALRFYTNGTEQVSIDSTGKVGIGSTQPTSTLDLDGTLSVSGISTFNDDVNVGTATTGVVARTDGTLNVSGISTFLGDINLQVDGSGDGSIGGALRIGQQGRLRLRAYNGFSYITSQNSNFDLQTNGTFRITNYQSYSIAQYHYNSGVKLWYKDTQKFGTTEDGFKVLNGTSETAVISGPQNIILDPSPDDVVSIVEGDISAAGVSTITGITTTNIAVGNLIQEVDGVISTGTTVTSVGISSLTISNVSLGSATNQEFTFVNQTPTGIVRIKGDLYVDGTRTEINSTTLTVDDLNVVVASGATNGLTADTAGLTVDGANAYLKYNYNAGTNETWELNKNVGIGTDNATAKLDVNGTLNVSGISTFHDNVNIADDKRLRLGADVNGLDIYHVSNGSVSDIKQNASGSLRIRANQIVFYNKDITSTWIGCSFGAVSLYHNNDIKLKTVSDGIEVRGNATVGTATTGVVARNDGTLSVSGISTFQGDVNIGIAATSTDLPGLYLKGNSSTANFLQNPSISIGGTTNGKYYNTFLVDAPFVQYVRHWANGLDINFSVQDARQFVVSNTNGANSINSPGVSDNQIAFRIIPESSTELRYNKVKKLETTGYGVSVTDGLNVSGISTFNDDVNVGTATTGVVARTDGTLNVSGITTIGSPVAATGITTNFKVQDGNSYLAVEFSGSGQTRGPYFASNGGSGGVYLSGDSDFAFTNYAGNEQYLWFESSSGRVRLSHGKGADYTTRLMTAEYGIDVTGRVETNTLNVSGISTFADVNVSGIATAQLFSGNGGSLTNVSAYDSYKSDISERAFKTDEISGSLVYAPDGQRFSNQGTGTGSANSFAIYSVISKDGKVAYVSEYDDQSQQLGTGRIHIYERTGANFTAIGIVTQTSHSSPGAAQTTTCFGPIIACNADGSIFAVGSPQGIQHGSGSSNSNFSWWHNPAGPGQQSVHIFQKNGSTITNIGILTSPSPGNQSNGSDSFGGALAFSDDGSKLYVGSPRREDNVNGFVEGAIFVYDKSGSTYNYVGIITSPNGNQLQGTVASMGQALACSSDGNIIFSGWPTAFRYNIGSTTNSRYSGAIEIYDRLGSNFNNVGIVSAGHFSSTGNALGVDFGEQLACSDDGTYLYAISLQGGTDPEAYPYGKLHLFKRELNVYSEVSSDILDSPISNFNTLGFGLACSSDGSKVITGECNVTSAGLGVTGFVRYYARVGDNITRIGFSTAGAAQGGSFQIAAFGQSLDMSGSGEVAIVGAPSQTYVGLGGAGAAFFLKETRGTAVYSDILTGNIGIKSDAPKATLDVNGDINVGAAVSLRAAYSGGAYPSDRLYITSTDPSRPGSIAIGTHGDWAGLNFADVDIVMMAHDTTFNFANIEITEVNSNSPLLEISSVQETSGLLREYSEIIQYKGDLTLLAYEDDSSIIFGTGNSGAQVIDTNDKPLVKLNVNPSNSADANIVLGGEMTLTPVGGGVTIGGNVDITGITTISQQLLINDVANNPTTLGTKLYVNGPSVFQDTVRVGSGGTIGDLLISGKVGIGSTQPTAKLDVDGTLNVSGIATIGNYLNIGGSDISIGSTTINGDQAITFDGTAGNLFTLVDNLTTGNLFTVNDVSGFSVFEVDVDGTTRMGLAINDKVGIGTTQPTAKLDVNGTLNVSGIATFQSNINLGDNDRLNFKSTNTRIYGSSGGLNIEASGTNDILIKSNSDGANHGNVEIRTGADGGKVYLTGTGGVGIYHTDTALKLETTGYGVSITGGLNVSGIATAQKFVGDGSELTNLPPAGSDLVTYASASNIANSAESISGISTYIQLDSLLSSQTAGAARPWRFGRNNAMSADASTLIVGAYEGSLNGSSDNTGLVHVFDREGNSYREVGILTAGAYADNGDNFGHSVACSTDGRRIVVGAYSDEPLGSTGGGLVHIFDRQGDTFTRVGVLTGSYASQSGDAFGYEVDCSGDGNVIVVGAKFDETGASFSTGVVYVFDRNGNDFTEVGIITSSSNAANGILGHSVSISEDGNTIVAGAIGDGSNNEGKVYVFDRTGTNTFNEVGILTGGTYANQGAEFGEHVKISSNGKTIVVGCSNAEVDEAVAGTGLVQIFDRNPDNTFTRVGVLTGSHASQSSDGFGNYIDVSADGNTIAVGAFFDELTGGNPIYDDDGLGYIFTRQGDTFEEVSTFIQGRVPKLSADGKTVAFGDPNYESGGSGAGRVLIFEQQRQTYLHSTSTGNIGIGVTNPTAKLDVDGSIAIKNHSIVSITTSHTASAGTPFTIDTFATSENDLAEYTMHVGYGTYIQAQKVLVMHNGTTAYAQESAVMHQPGKIVSIDATISGGNVLLQATPETGVSGITTYKIVRGGLV